jgi:hypothetical protein
MAPGDPALLREDARRSMKAATDHAAGVSDFVSAPPVLDLLLLRQHDRPFDRRPRVDALRI